MQGKLIDFGISQQEFADRYFEQQPFLHTKALSERLVNWDQISAAFYAVDPANPGIKVFRDGPVDRAEYLENYQDGRTVASRFKPGALEQLLRSGSTLVINRLDKYVDAVGALTQEVGDFTNSRTVANAYVAFGGNGTFGKHWDTHCVFSLQLRGRKRWRVFQPTVALPLDHQRSTARKDECPDTAVFDTILEAGDALYIPRGWWHEALPIAGVDTLHVAVGIHTPKMHDYLCWVASHILAQRTELRRSWIDSDLPAGEVEAIMSAFSEAFASSNNQRAFMEKHARLRVAREAIDFSSILAG